MYDGLSEFLKRLDSNLLTSFIYAYFLLCCFYISFLSKYFFLTILDFFWFQISIKSCIYHALYMCLHVLQYGGGNATDGRKIYEWSVRCVVSLGIFFKFNIHVLAELLPHLQIIPQGQFWTSSHFRLLHRYHYHYHDHIHDQVLPLMHQDLLLS